jgi:hypothetical protein
MSIGMMFGSRQNASADEWSTDEDGDYEYDDDGEDDDEFAPDDYYDDVSATLNDTISKINVSDNWEPAAKHYSNMNLKDQASLERKNNGNGNNSNKTNENNTANNNNVSNTQLNEEDREKEKKLKQARKKAEKRRKQKEKKILKSELEGTTNPTSTDDNKNLNHYSNSPHARFIYILSISEMNLYIVYFLSIFFYFFYIYFQLMMPQKIN